MDARQMARILEALHGDEVHGVSVGCLLFGEHNPTRTMRNYI